MKYAYIISNENYYVPRAPSFCQARERNDLFLEKLNIEPMVVSPAEWNILTSMCEIKYLEVDDV